MPQAVPTQHPAVVLRSHYRQLRALLAIAMIAVIGLSAAVVILADDKATSTRTATPASTPTEPAAGPRYIHPPGQRYNSGPNEHPRGYATTIPPANPHDRGPANRGPGFHTN
jgi:hypothetical protein